MTKAKTSDNCVDALSVPHDQPDYSQCVVAYLEQRGIEPELQQQLGISWVSYETAIGEPYGFGRSATSPEGIIAFPLDRECQTFAARNWYSSPDEEKAHLDKINKENQDQGKAPEKRVPKYLLPAGGQADNHTLYDPWSLLDPETPPEGENVPQPVLFCTEDVIGCIKAADRGYRILSSFGVWLGSREDLDASTNPGWHHPLVGQFPAFLADSDALEKASVYAALIRTGFLIDCSIGYFPSSGQEKVGLDEWLDANPDCTEANLRALVEENNLDVLAWLEQTLPNLLPLLMQRQYNQTQASCKAKEVREAGVQELIKHQSLEDLRCQGFYQRVLKPMGLTLEYLKPREKKVRKEFRTQRSSPNHTFLQQAEEHLFGEGDWICFNWTLYRWEDTYYRACQDEALYPRVKEYADQFEEVQDDGTIDYPYAKPYWVKQVLDWVKQGFAVTSERINPPGINCTNGVLEFQWDELVLTVELCPHDPGRHLFLSEPQACYDPDASPTEYNQLMECLDPAPREILERTLAASLDLRKVRQSRGRAVKALFLKGDGSNGKDTIRFAIELLLGSTAIASCSVTDWKQYDEGRCFPIYSLLRCRINWPSENADVGRVDGLRGLRAAITGDYLTFEQKNKDAVQEPCNAVFLFNCNESPNLVAQLKATETRWGMVPFTKTYAMNPKEGELQADPRYKEDPEFVKQRVLPAMLNRLIEQLQAVVREGIDYYPTQDMFAELQRESSHLLQFAHDCGLHHDPQGEVTVQELWTQLQEWYIRTGTLQIETITSGTKTKEKRTWNDQPRRSDRNVKAVNQIVQRFSEVFPKAKRATRIGADGHNQIIVLKGLSFSRSPETPQTSPQIGHGDYGNGTHNAQSAEITGSSESIPSSTPWTALGMGTASTDHGIRTQLPRDPYSAPCPDASLKSFQNGALQDSHAHHAQISDYLLLPEEEITDVEEF